MHPHPVRTPPRTAKSGSISHFFLTASPRKLTLLVALPAVLLVLPLFLIMLFGRRRYY
ncbi:MAG TPA: hypothetical protein VMW75_20690 [Thermoanaerobaculia bacterium]|nr:hypothetical protein [Thermoanaerobaculia bacterium]